MGLDARGRGYHPLYDAQQPRLGGQVVQHRGIGGCGQLRRPRRPHRRRGAGLPRRGELHRRRCRERQVGGTRSRTHSARPHDRRRRGVQARNQQRTQSSARRLERLRQPAVGEPRRGQQSGLLAALARRRPGLSWRAGRRGGIRLRRRGFVGGHIPCPQQPHHGRQPYQPPLLEPRRRGQRPDDTRPRVAARLLQGVGDGCRADTYRPPYRCGRHTARLYLVPPLRRRYRVGVQPYTRLPRLRPLLRRRRLAQEHPRRGRDAPSRCSPRSRA